MRKLRINQYSFDWQDTEKCDTFFLTIEGQALDPRPAAATTSSRRELPMDGAGSSSPEEEGQGRPYPLFTGRVRRARGSRKDCRHDRFSLRAVAFDGRGRRAAVLRGGRSRHARTARRTACVRSEQTSIRSPAPSTRADAGEEGSWPARSRTLTWSRRQSRPNWPK